MPRRKAKSPSTSLKAGKKLKVKSEKPKLGDKNAGKRNKKVKKERDKVSLRVKVIKTHRQEKEADKAEVSDMKKKDKLAVGARRRRAKSVGDKGRDQAKKAVSKNEIQEQVKEKVIDYERVERDKRLMMWSGVAFFMVLITILWIFNINKTLSRNKIKNHNGAAQMEWQKITGEIRGSIKQMEEDLAKIRSAKLKATEVNEDSVKPERNLFGPEEIEALKEKLEKQQKLSGK